MSWPLRPVGVNHLLQPPPLAWTLLNGRLCPVLAPAVVAELNKWLSAQLGTQPGDTRPKPREPLSQLVMQKQP